MLTKKHFEELARIVYQSKQVSADPVKFIQDELSRFCRAENPGFDSMRFHQACDEGRVSARGSTKPNLAGWAR